MTSRRLLTALSTKTILDDADHWWHVDDGVPGANLPTWTDRNSGLVLGTNFSRYPKVRGDGVAVEFLGGRYLYGSYPSDPNQTFAIIVRNLCPYYKWQRSILSQGSSTSGRTSIRIEDDSANHRGYWLRNGQAFTPVVTRDDAWHVMIIRCSSVTKLLTFQQDSTRWTASKSDVSPGGGGLMLGTHDTSTGGSPYAFTGEMAQVFAWRRAVSDEEMDEIAALLLEQLPDPPPIFTADHWWDARDLPASTLVPSWVDKYGGVALTQGNTDRQPTTNAGKDRIVFQGEAHPEWLSNSSIVREQAETTAIIARYVTLPSSNLEGVLMSSRNTYPRFIRGLPGSTSKMGAGGGHNGSGSTNTVSVNGLSTAWRVIVLRTSASETKLWVDALTPSSSSASANAAGVGLLLSAQWTSSSPANPVNSEVAHVLKWNRALSDAEVYDLQKSLNLLKPAT